MHLSQRELDESDLNYLMLGVRGCLDARDDLLRAIFGDPDAKRPTSPTPPAELPRLTPKMFDALFSSSGRGKPH